MANKLTLDQVLADLYEHTGDKDLDPEWVDVVQQNNKQAILQWVADEVVGEDGKLYDPSGSIKKNGVFMSPRGENQRIRNENNHRTEQRQILKAHGWKES